MQAQNRHSYNEEILLPYILNKTVGYIVDFKNECWWAGSGAKIISAKVQGINLCLVNQGSQVRFPLSQSVG